MTKPAWEADPRIGFMKLTPFDGQAVGDNQKSRRWWSGLITQRTVFRVEKFKCGREWEERLLVV